VTQPLHRGLVLEEEEFSASLEEVLDMALRAAAPDEADAFEMLFPGLSETTSLATPAARARDIGAAF
jgi:hypothetical protein